MVLDDGVAVADSPAASDVQPTDTSAGTQNTVNGQPSAQPKQTPFHEHPRFREVIGQNQQMRAEVARLTQVVQDLQRQAAQPARTADEKQQRADAIKALRELIAEDPELAPLLNISKELPRLQQGYQGVEEMAKAQQNQQMGQARSHVQALATKEGWKLDKDDLADLVMLTARRAQRIEGAAERFESGDLSVLTEAFEGVKGNFLGQLGRARTQNILDTKIQTRGLPPAPRGGAGSRDAMPKLDPDNPRAYRDALHKGAMARLAELQGSQGS